MTRSPIIKHFNVIEYFCLSFFPCIKDIPLYLLLLKATEEGFSHCIVIIIKAPANARNQVVARAKPVTIGPLLFTTFTPALAGIALLGRSINEPF